METNDFTCGDPDCLCAVADPLYAPYDQEDQGAPTVTAVSALEDAVNGFGAEAYQTGYADGAREALDNLFSVKVSEDDPQSLAHLAGYADELDLDLADLEDEVEVLNVRLDRWAPVIDQRLELLEETFLHFLKVSAEVFEGQETQIADLSRRVAFIDGGALLRVAE